MNMGITWKTLGTVSPLQNHLKFHLKYFDNNNLSFELYYCSNRYAFIKYYENREIALLCYVFYLQKPFFVKHGFKIRLFNWSLKNNDSFLFLDTLDSMIGYKRFSVASIYTSMMHR